jgi:hypothetical protein
LGVLGQVLEAERFGEFLPAVWREPERRKESSLKPTDRMCRGQQVVAQLRRFDRRPIRIGDEHR